MNPERWRQIEELFHSAFERAPEDRKRFLEDACRDDADLRVEVESLLAHRLQAGSFLETPALSSPATSSTGAVVGRQFGPYRILSPLGAGGMGEVYRAHDSKLGRDVAIKTLPPEFARDPERLARFRREARTLATLNHPNIAAIYGLEESDNMDYLVLELVEGETLAEQMRRTGPLPVGEALDYAGQIAAGLEAAHGKGIIHRDLKPANVKVTPEGRVKVLDFGLAKAVWGGEEGPNRSEPVTATMAATLAGHIMGTPPYMSPEQACGKQVDKRTDIWAFGCVLYELLSGRQTFQGDTFPETTAAILQQEPAWQVLPTKTPTKIRELLRRCLQKDAGSRLQDIADARRVIEEAIAPARGVKRWQLIAAAALGLAVVAAAVWLYRPSRLPSRADYIQITNFPDSVSQPALSPDGRMLTFIRGFSTFLAPGEVYVKMLPSGEPVQLTHDSLPKMSPVFSPDGSRIAYTALTGRFNWDTWVVPVLGGQPQRWLPNASGLVWAGPQHLMFSEIKSGEHMVLVSSLESRAESRDIYTPPHERGMAHRSYLSPDGKWVLLAEMDNGEWLPCRMVPFNGGSPGRRVGLPDAPCTNAAWSPDGRWIYLNLHAGDNFHIWRQRFPEGQPEQITSGPTEDEGIALAPDGRSLATSVGLRQRTVSVHDPSGDRQISIEGYAYKPVISPDGKRLYYRVLKGGTSPYLGASELWVADIESGRNELLLPGFAVTSYSVSPDGRRVVFSALDSSGKSRLWVASTDRTVAPRQIPNIEGDMPCFGPPGELIFHAIEENSTFAFRIHEDGTGRQRLTSQQIAQLHGLSPDGKFIIAWLAMSGEQNRSAMQAFPLAGGPPMPIFDAMGDVRWQPDGRLLYLSVVTAMQSAGASGHTYVLPVPPGKLFPSIPPGGYRSEAEIAALPGVRVIDAADVAPGPKPGVYAFSRQTVQRNLYRIPLP
jgi:Tol biopolymer transport system component